MATNENPEMLETNRKLPISSCNGNHVFMIDHGYPWLFHGHVFIFHTHGQECNHSAMKTWLTIVIIMVITSFPIVNHSSLN